MIYYCYDCEYAEEIDDKDVASGKIQLSEICPRCNSINVSLREDSSQNIGKTLAWWLLVAPFITFVITIVPLGLASIFENKNDVLYDLLMFISVIVYLVSYIYAGMAPKIYKKKMRTEKYTQAMQALELKDYKTAEQNFTDILKAEPRESEIYLERGKVRLLNNQLPLATSDFTIATLLQPNNVEYAYYRATIFMSYMDDEAYNIAIERFSALILNGYVKDECFNSRGECYLATHQYEKALADFEKAVKLNPNNETYKNNKKTALSKVSTGEFVSTSILEPAIETMYEDNAVEEDIKIDLATCTKEELMKLKVFDESKADDFISTRQTGKLYYDIETLTQDFNLQPHEIVQIQDKLIFPLKPQAKKGRAIDF